MYFRTASLTELSISLRNNTLSLEDYITESCGRLNSVDKEVKAFLPEKNRMKRLLAEAEALRNQYPNPASRPPLYGVLIGIKDLFYVDGFNTRAGSKLPVKAFSGEEAWVVTRLKQAGALILGKTHTTEFAYFSPGPTRNPHNLDHTPGGSSSGSAAAVAAGFCPLALGTQTIASITRPAAYCGIVGFKPTYGRIPMAGIVPFAQSVDHVGFFAQDLAGISLAASVMIADWDTTIRTSAKPRIYLPSDAFLVQADYDSFNRFYEKVDVLTERGYEIANYPLFREIAEVNKVHRELIAAEFARNHKQWFKEYGELYSEPSRELYKQGSKVSKTSLATDLAILQTYRQSVREIMSREGVDLWICPATTSAAPKGLTSTGSPLMSLPWTFTGLPSLTLPVARASNGLPLGLQVIGGFGRDERLLQYALEIFQVLSY
jgi:Asp-tRNA(Asn)/Glu-tRNA(Gln) amidotransferase A subunit family amidase